VAAIVASCAAPGAAVRQYSGSSVTLTSALAKGGVSITNANGGVWVDTASASGSVSVTGLPFATGPDDASARQAAIAAQASLSLTVVPDGQGGVTVNGSGDDATGFDLEVHLPYPFDGLLTIDAGNGYVHYVGSSGAKGVAITVGTGDIFVQDGGQHVTIAGGTSNIDVITLPTVAGTSITIQVDPSARQERPGGRRRHQRRHVERHRHLDRGPRSQERDDPARDDGEHPGARPVPASSDGQR
jgi:hypothetical protein